MSLRQGCQERGATRVWGYPGAPPRPTDPSEKPWLPGHALTDLAVPSGALLALSGQGREGGKAGCWPGRGQQAGHRPALPHGRGLGSVAQGVTNQVS